MRTHATYRSCQCWLVSALAVLLQHAANGQGNIVFVQEPPSAVQTFPWDAYGTLVSGTPDSPSLFPITINGQVAFTFYSGTGFDIIPSSSSAVIAVQPGLPDTQAAFPVPLSAGQQIGPDAAGYSWLGNIEGGDTLTAARDGGIIGQPPLTDGYFTGVEQAYIGFQFQQDGQTYYGWASVGCPIVGINAGWVYSYAYETTPNTPILAGEVPEPSTLALLAAGGTLLLSRRKVIR